VEGPADSVHLRSAEPLMRRRGKIGRKKQRKKFGLPERETRKRDRRNKSKPRASIKGPAHGANAQ